MHSGMKLNPDSPICLAARFFPKTACDLHSKLPTRCSSETKMSRASILDARLPVVHLQRLGLPLFLVARLFFLQRCSFHLQASSKRTHAYTTQSQDSPSRGAVAGHTRTVNTQTRCPNAATIPKGVFTTEQSKWYIKCSHATTNLISLPTGILY